MNDRLARWLLVLPLLASLPTLGCSVYMAAKQPAKKDLTVLHAGTPRALVLAELGQPVATTERNGETQDVFAFRQGYSTGAKATRAVFHATADVFTLGLWEVVGTPAEAIFDGTEVKVEVTYDANDEVKLVRTFAGASELETAPAAGVAVPTVASAPVAASVPTTGVATPTAADAAAKAAAARDYRRRLDQEG